MRDQPHALQRNAADPRQGKFAARAERRREERRANMYRAVLHTAEGRMMLADLVVRSGAFKSPWNPHGGVQSANIGRMEIGLELDEYLRLIEPTLRRQMWAEWDALLERDNRETDAAHMAAVSTEGA
jgi:hypothetical protein